MDWIWVLVPVAWAPASVWIVLAGIKFAERKEEMKMRVKLETSGADRFAAQNADLKSEVSRLKDRVTVLERLVTDGDQKLAREFERLEREGSNTNL
ncbi:MAG: hypothetical protein R3C52_06105 [Hyphomonadaceae bacterium]